MTMTEFEAIEYRHIMDPLDTDGGPLQRLAYEPGAIASQTPHSGASGVPGPGATQGDHPASGRPADAAVRLSA